MDGLRLNFAVRMLQHVSPTGALAKALATRYRTPIVRWAIRTRALAQDGRARAAGARSATTAWLMERAPHWVVVLVTALLVEGE